MIHSPKKTKHMVLQIPALEGFLQLLLVSGWKPGEGKKKKKEELKICSFQFTLKQNTHIQESKLILLSEMRMKICTEICI